MKEKNITDVVNESVSVMISCIDYYTDKGISAETISKIKTMLLNEVASVELSEGYKHYSKQYQEYVQIFKSTQLHQE